MTIDLVMVILLPMLMGYSLVGELWHEIIGIAMVASFAIHIFLNRKWFTSLFKGKYNAKRIRTTSLNLLLALCVLTSIVSAVFISKHIFSFLGINILSSAMRSLHLLAAYWGFVLMSLHAGTHGGAMLSKLWKNNSAAKNMVSVIAIIIALYGVYAFIKRGFAGYLFMQTAFVFFDYSEPFIFFYLDYLSVMILFMTVGFLIDKLLTLGGKNGIYHTERR